ncbi:MAG: DMT family transporter [Steroidobacteraceae bacterium]
MSAQSATAGAGQLAPRDLSLLLVINLIWGLNLIAGKIGVQNFPPVFFTVLRFGMVSACLLPFLRWHSGQMANITRAALYTGGIAFALLFCGLRITADASTVAIATQLGVPFSTLLSVWLLGETIRWQRRLGIALAFLGVVIIGFDPRVFSYWPGLALVVVSTFVGSLGLIYIKRLHNIPAIQVQAWVSTLSWPMLLATSLAMEHGQWAAVTNAGMNAWLALLFTVFGSSLIAHTGWYYLISRYPVTSVAPLTLLSPLFGVLFGVTVLNDHLTWRMFVGGAITLIGVFIVIRRERRLVDTGT